MREIRTSGSVRGASGDGRPYRERVRALQHSPLRCVLWPPFSAVASHQSKRIKRWEGVDPAEHPTGIGDVQFEALGLSDAWRFLATIRGMLMSPMLSPQQNGASALAIVGQSA